MNRFFAGSLFFICLLICDMGFARTALDFHCNKVFTETQQCPDALCQVRCYGGIDYPECDIECLGKECTAISPSTCPRPTCQVVKGCDAEDLCLPNDEREGRECGELGYIGNDFGCCEGLQRRCGIPLFDGTCDEVPERSIYAAPMCLPCGNGTCDTLENECNCPEDCKQDLDVQK